MGSRSERGSAVLVALFVMLIAGVVGLSAAMVSSTEVEITGNYRGAMRAFYASDGASQFAFDELINLSRSLGRPATTAEAATIMEPAFDSVSLTSFDIATSGPAVTQTLTSGYYQGLTATTQPYQVTTVASTDEFPPGVGSVTLRGDLDVIPLFQFAVFYDQIMEIYPGPPMLLSGRVHGNSDIYLRSWNGFTIDSVLTSAGDIHNRRLHDAQLPGGGEFIRDGLGNFPAMAGLDSTDPDWYAQALTRWNGNVRSSAHGVKPLNPTVPDGFPPRTLIEPGLASDSATLQNTKLYYDTGLRIVNGVAYDPAGIPVSTIDPVTGDNAIRETVIFDAKEDKEILTLEIDVELLGRSPAYPANGAVYLLSAEPGDGIPAWPAMPAPWVPYGMPYNGNDTEFGFKLTNGSNLPSALSFVSDNPVYVRGDYNSVAKKPAAVMADVIYILSNSWGRKDAGGNPVPGGDPDDDLGYGQLDYDERIPTDTTINSAFMLGTYVSTWGQYQGGLENIFRMLEYWSGVNMNYRGSFICLWNPVHATAGWVYGDPVYKPPTRDWGFDPDLLDMSLQPPLTPKVYAVRFTEWSRQ